MDRKSLDRLVKREVRRMRELYHASDFLYIAHSEDGRMTVDYKSMRFSEIFSNPYRREDFTTEMKYLIDLRLKRSKVINFSVHHKYRGDRLGSEMARHIERISTKAGCAFISLVRPTTLPFWEGRGYGLMTRRIAEMYGLELISVFSKK